MHIDVAVIRPALEFEADEFGSVIAFERSWQTEAVCQVLKHRDDAATGQRRIDLDLR